MMTELDKLSPEEKICVGHKNEVFLACKPFSFLPPLSHTNMLLQPRGKGGCASYC